MKGIIVGAGRAGQDLHYGAFKVAGAEILAFVDPNLDAAKKAAERFNLKNYFSSIEEALDNLTVDFVSICTPPQTHYGIAKYALEHGCHVLLEKPLSITVEEAEKLDKVRAKTEKTLEVIHNYKFAPWFLRIKK
jgi:predicted dehydrogenase